VATSHFLQSGVTTRKVGSIHSEDEELKNIPICELFYRIAMDIVGPLPKTRSGNKYIIMAIDHYSKWCEAKAIANHGANIEARFMEDNGQQSLMSCVKTMGFTINIQHLNGHNVMGWLNV
jgi:hypothetical protein